MDLLMDPSVMRGGPAACYPCTEDDFNYIAKNHANSSGEDHAAQDDSEAFERDKEQYLRDLKALYAASASASNNQIQSGETEAGINDAGAYEPTPLDQKLDEIDGDYLHHQHMQQQHTEQLQYDEYQQLAQQLQYEQQEREYYESWRDAKHWAKAFGVNLDDTNDRDGNNNETRTKKSRIKDTSKPGIGHKEVIYGISFGEDGKYAATASQDATVCIWEVATNRLLSTLKGHDVKYECLRVEWATRKWADSVLDRSFLFANLIASSGADGKVKLWACKNDDESGRDDQGLRTIDNKWKCEYTLDHANLLSRGVHTEEPVKEKETADDDDYFGVGVDDKKGSDDKPQVYSLQFIDHWKVFTKDLSQQNCSHHSKQKDNPKELKEKNDDFDQNSFLMTSSDEFIHLWEIERHPLDQQLSLDGQKIHLLQEKIKLKEVLSLYFGPLDDHSYGVTACSITGEGLDLPAPPTKSSEAKDGSVAFGGERNPSNTIFVFDAAYSPGSGLLGVALSDGSLRLVNGRGYCISVIQLPGSKSHLTSFCWDATGNRLATCVGTGHLITWSLDPESHDKGNYHTAATCTAIFEGGHQSGRPLFGSRFCGGEDENLLISWGIDGKLCLWHSKASGNIYDPVAILKDDGSYPIFAVEISRSERNLVVGGGSEGGFIGVPLHFYSIPPLTNITAGAKEEQSDDDDGKTKEVSEDS
uniref:Uncharacterized protein n=1 Tax=Pseudo-nitzschia australis TaxID=44445 RepID=A0A7S4AKL3_9STRA